MKTKKNPAAVAPGRKGGQAIAQRGPEYFAQLHASVAQPYPVDPRLFAEQRWPVRFTIASARHRV
jgi:hypothetical protein